MAQPTSAIPAIATPSPAQVGRAMRLTYAQAMLWAVFGASTGGMFLTGFALRLGAGDVLIGLISSVPPVLVVFQLLAAYFVERGVSRKRLTVAFAMLTPLCWFLIAALPFLAPALATWQKFTVLIGVISLVNLAGQFANNARSSWLGDLIPAQRRGRFFGHVALFAGLVGAVFAVVEGGFLDFVKQRGLFAFTNLFFFGAVFGLAAACLHVPQPDCPLSAGKDRPSFGRLMREAFRNRPLVMLALVHATVALGGIAGPFGNAYLLRDVGLSFLGLGLVNAVATAAMLASSPLWGRAADRFGARPVLILGLVILAPTALVWLLIPPHSPHLAYLVLPWSSIVGGLGNAAFGVGINALSYNLSLPRGRSVQFALYSVFVTLIGAPMPVLGGWLVSRLQGSGYHVDLRLLFYAWMVFIIAAAALATWVREPQAVSTRSLVFTHLPNRVAQLWESVIG